MLPSLPIVIPGSVLTVRNVTSARTSLVHTGVQQHVTRTGEDFPCSPETGFPTSFGIRTMQASDPPEVPRDDDGYGRTNVVMIPKGSKCTNQFEQIMFANNKGALTFSIWAGLEEGGSPREVGRSFAYFPEGNWFKMKITMNLLLSATKSSDYTLQVSVVDIPESAEPEGSVISHIDEIPASAWTAKMKHKKSCSQGFATKLEDGLLTHTDALVQDQCLTLCLVHDKAKNAFKKNGKICCVYNQASGTCKYKTGEWTYGAMNGNAAEKQKWFAGTIDATVTYPAYPDFAV